MLEQQVDIHEMADIRVGGKKYSIASITDTTRPEITQALMSVGLDQQRREAFAAQREAASALRPRRRN